MLRSAGKGMAVLFAWLTLLGASPLAAAQTALVNATVYRGGEQSEPIEGATIVMTDGVITSVGSEVAPPSGATVIDVEGAIITPGLVDVATGLGLVEIWAVKASRDTAPADPVRPAFRTRDGYNPEATAIAVSRKGGITSAVSLPAGGLIGGQAFHCELSEKPVAESCSESPAFMVVRLGEDGAGSVGGSRAEAVLRLREVLEDARVFGQNREAFEGNSLRELTVSRLDLEALQPVLGGELPVLFQVSRASDVDQALAIAEEFGLQPMILGGSEGWQRTDALTNIPVVVDPMQNAPESFESLDARPDLAAMLSSADIPVVISSFDTHNARTLRQSAGNAVRAGMSWRAALAAVTHNAASAAGKGDELGLIEAGYRANLVVWSGDPFELETRVLHVFIDGEEMSLQTRQTRLFERYAP